jgi:hypothetical protein
MSTLLTILKTIGSYLLSAFTSSASSSMPNGGSTIGTVVAAAGGNVAGEQAATFAANTQSLKGLDDAASAVTQAEDAAPADTAAMVDRLRNGAGL